MSQMFVKILGHDDDDDNFYKNHSLRHSPSLPMLISAIECMEICHCLFAFSSEGKGNHTRIESTSRSFWKC